MEIENLIGKEVFVSGQKLRFRIEGKLILWRDLFHVVGEKCEIVFSRNEIAEIWNISEDAIWCITLKV